MRVTPAGHKSFTLFARPASGGTGVFACKCGKSVLRSSGLRVAKCVANADQRRVDMLTTGIRRPVGLKISGAEFAEIEKVGVPRSGPTPTRSRAYSCRPRMSCGRSRWASWRA
jgi:hypothetical protein